MKKFDYSFLKNSIPGNLVGISNIVFSLKTKEDMRKAENKEAFESLRKSAIIKSIKSSNAIEGIVTTDTRIKDIIDGKPPITHDEKEISGYKDALALIHSEYNTLDFDIELICRFHKLLVGEVSPSEGGKFKSRDNLIMEYNSDGTRRIRFRPVPFSETEKAIEQLILAYMDARQDAEIPDLFLIQCVILDFLCIHPFTDGNGRISRLLTVLLLYLHGYDIGRYISLEGMINEYKESYYDALEKSSENWHKNENDYAPFILSFLQIVYRCYKELDEQFMNSAIKKAKKSERIEAVVMNAIVPISKSEIADRFPDISIKTIEYALSNMLKNGKIMKIGTYKNARYYKK